MIDNIKEKPLKELASQLNIPVVHGWKTALNKRLLQKKPSIISTWISRGTPKKFEDILVAANIDIDIWRKIIENINISDTIKHDKTKTYPVPNESLNNLPTSEQQPQYPDPESPLQMAVKILHSDSEYKRALDSNIIAFHAAIKMNDKLEKTNIQLAECQAILKEQQIFITQMKADHEQEVADLKNKIKLLNDKLLLIETG